MPGSAEGLMHHGAGAVTKQHGGISIRPVGDARERFGAHHQRALRLARLHELVGDGQRVDETAAGGFHRERRAAARTEARLQQRAAVGEHEVGRGGAEHDEIDFSRRDARGLDGAARGDFADVDGSLAFGRDVPALDAGASADPLVGGIHLLFEIEVRDDLFRKIGACAGDT